ncbi:MAG: amino acid ABC transporter ATP-binding protein [Castellaniella sp.]|uniref:amino acid ABC transporter ATP-binding protein n=1 Tax=Castellaniella sp. TaxID=1955812 RepID=UPI003C708C18
MGQTNDDILINISGLRKTFKGVSVLNGVDLTVRRGELSFIIGPSGGGKSTLLRCMNFLETPDAGQIDFSGTRLCGGDGGAFSVSPAQTLQRARAKMPMVFQHFNLFNHKTVLDNVIEGPVMVNGRDKREAIEHAGTLLAQFGLGDHADKYPAQLSGGQKQRVAIVRALAMEPEAILFDEPTSALDPQLVGDVLDAMRKLAGSGLTLVVVTHEMSFARALADSIHFVSGGRIAESGSAEAVFDRPQTEDLKRFIQSIRA